MGSSPCPTRGALYRIRNWGFLKRNLVYLVYFVYIVYIVYKVCIEIFWYVVPHGGGEENAVDGGEKCWAVRWWYRIKDFQRPQITTLVRMEIFNFSHFYFHPQDIANVVLKGFLDSLKNKKVTRRRLFGTRDLWMLDNFLWMCPFGYFTVPSAHRST